MTNQEIARDRFKAFQDEMTVFTFGDWAVLDIPTREARGLEIEQRHGYRHGWINVNGEGFNMQAAFPERSFLNVWD